MTVHEVCLYALVCVCVCMNLALPDISKHQLHSLNELLDLDNCLVGDVFSPPICQHSLTLSHTYTGRSGTLTTL